MTCEIMKNMKAQGSTEYLVILGAVLMVSLVIVSLLGSFPSSGSSTKEQQSKSYWSGTTPFAISVAKVSNSTFSFTVSNKLTEKIYLTSVEVQDGAGNSRTIMTPNRVFNAGEETVLTQLSAANITNSSINPCYSTGTAKTGSAFEFKVVSFTYTQGSIAGIRQQGSQSLIGRCSSDLSIGDSYQGGKIAYLLQQGDTGFVAGEQHGLIAATSDLSAEYGWGCFGTAIAGADGTAIGTGHQNTHDIIAGGDCTRSYDAAQFHGVTMNGYSDWFLPSQDELNKLYLNRVAIGGFVGQYYWSSSEASADNAWEQDFTNSIQYLKNKWKADNVRAVRSF
ncbi:MAG: DUF1566 domain-containing protein [Candidatus Micrarchaeia archaeon]